MVNEQDSPLVDEAINLGATPLPPYSSIEFNPHPYSKVTVYLGGNSEEDGKAVMYALDQFFGGQGYINSIIQPTTIPQNPPQTPPQAAQQPQAPQMAPPQGNAAGQPIQAAEQLFCPTHREVVRPSKYPKYDVLDSGEQVQSNYWHPIAPYIDAQTNKEIKSHSLWRRELVHADGSPVEGGQMGGA